MITDCGSHTHTLVPDLDNNRILVYVSSYALTAGSLGPNCLADTGTTKGHNKISVVSIPLANPAAQPGSPSRRSIRGCNSSTATRSSRASAS